MFIGCTSDAMNLHGSLRGLGDFTQNNDWFVNQPVGASVTLMSSIGYGSVLAPDGSTWKYTGENYSDAGSFYYYVKIAEPVAGVVTGPPVGTVATVEPGSVGAVSTGAIVTHDDGSQWQVVGEHSSEATGTQYQIVKVADAPPLSFEPPAIVATVSPVPATLPNAPAATPVMSPVGPGASTQPIPQVSDGGALAPVYQTSVPAQSAPVYSAPAQAAPVYSAPAQPTPVYAPASSGATGGGLPGVTYGPIERSNAATRAGYDQPAAGVDVGTGEDYGRGATPIVGDVGQVAQAASAGRGIAWIVAIIGGLIASNQS